MVFRKAGLLPRNLEFIFDNTALEIVGKFTYLGVVFTSGGSFTEAQNTLAGQARKALFIVEKYIYKFTTLSTSHMIDLFDKLILPILNYCSEVWGFIPAHTIENVYICNTARNYLMSKKAHKTILFMGNLGELLWQWGGVILLLSIGSKI